LNYSTLARLRFDRNRTADETDSLPHADQSKPLLPHDDLGVKTDSGVAYRQLDLICHFVQIYFEVPRTAIFERVLQGFLQDAEETKRDLFGDRP